MIIYSPFRRYTFGSFQIGVESVACIVAFTVFITLVVLALEKRKTKLDVKEYFFFFFVVLFSALAGGRLWYYIAHWKGPSSLITMFNLSKPGLVSLGVIVGGAVGLLIYSLNRSKQSKENWQLELARFADVIAAPAALAFFIFRSIGCTIRGDIKGTPTDASWCFLWTDGVCRHPVSVYLALGALLVYILLKVFFSREKTVKNKFGKRFDGEVILWFLLLYCFNRFWIEFMVASRNLPVVKHLGLSAVQWVCLAITGYSIIHLSLEYLVYHKLGSCGYYDHLRKGKTMGLKNCYSLFRR